MAATVAREVENSEAPSTPLPRQGTPEPHETLSPSKDKRGEAVRMRIELKDGTWEGTHRDTACFLVSQIPRAKASLNPDGMILSTLDAHNPRAQNCEKEAPMDIFLGDNLHDLSLQNTVRFRSARDGNSHIPKKPAPKVDAMNLCCSPATMDCGDFVSNEVQGQGQQEELTCFWKDRTDRRCQFIRSSMTAEQGDNGCDDQEPEQDKGVENTQYEKQGADGLECFRVMCGEKDSQNAYEKQDENTLQLVDTSSNDEYESSIHDSDDKENAGSLAQSSTRLPFSTLDSKEGYEKPCFVRYADHLLPQFEEDSGEAHDRIVLEDMLAMDGNLEHSSVGSVPGQEDPTEESVAVEHPKWTRGNKWRIMVMCVTCIVFLVFVAPWHKIRSLWLGDIQGRTRLSHMFPSDIVCSPIAPLEYTCLLDPSDLSAYRLRGTCVSQAERVFGFERCPKIVKGERFIFRHDTQASSQVPLEQGLLLQLLYLGMRFVAFIAALGLASRLLVNYWGKLRARR